MLVETYWITRETGTNDYSGGYTKDEECVKDFYTFNADALRNKETTHLYILSINGVCTANKTFDEIDLLVTY